MDERQQDKSELQLETATVFWSFKNILTDVNDLVTDADTGSQIIRFTNGYYNIRDIQREFKSKKITLISNFHNCTCSVKSTEKNLKMGKLGAMLGFDENKVFTKNLWHHSGQVMINHGLRYIKIAVDAVEKNLVYDERGRRSSLVACLPIDTSQPLFKTRTVYENIKVKVPITSSFSSLRFTMFTNIEWPVELNALLDIDIH